MSSLQIRALTQSAANYATRLAAQQAIDPNATTTIADLKYWDDWWDPKYHHYRFVAELDGEPVAIAGCEEWIWWYEPGRYLLYIKVAPAYRRQGIGGKLYDQLLATLSKADPQGRILMCKCREDQPESERFIRKRGFPLVGKESFSLLDVATFDASKYTSALERVHQQSIEIITYPEMVKQIPDWQQPCFDMYWASRKDTPATGTHTRHTLEHYLSSTFEYKGFLPDAFFVAMDNGVLVGESHLLNEDDDLEHLSTGYTGVIPSHRRRGIATALKVRVIQYAQSQGVKTIRTSNHEDNPMLQLNFRLGFQPQPGELFFEMRLDEQSGDSVAA